MGEKNAKHGFLTGGSQYNLAEPHIPGNKLNTDSFNFRILMMATLVALSSATAGVAFWKITEARKHPVRASLIVLPESRVIADFALTDHHAQPFSLAELRDQWSLIFFGFTHCPDVCPTALYELQQVRNIMKEKIHGNEKMDGEIAMPRILFISVDPERDTPENLQQYLSHFDPAFIGLTGEHEQLLPLTRQMGIAYRIEEHADGALQYGVDHSAGILLINPAGRLHGVFPAPHHADKISADLLDVIEAMGAT